MSGLNLEQLKKAEEELKSRSGGSGMFVRLGQDETKDIRILDPTPSMNGLYYIEVPIWWINGKAITSPKFLGESDLVEDIMAQFESEFGETEEGADQFKKLKNAEKSKGMKLIQETTGFWVPILEFEWQLKNNNQITGIYKEDGETIDPVLVKKFIVNGKAKVLDAKISLLKDINRQLTTGRSGATFLDKDKGFNMLISRAGTGRDTKYTAQKDEQMPMPEEFYGAGALDVVDVAKASIFTNEYIEAVLANYFFGEKLPDEAEYRFPELREQLKDGDSTEEAAPTRRRRGSVAESAPVEEPAEEPAEEKAEPTTTRRSRATATAEPAPRQRRSLLKDTAASGD